MQKHERLAIEIVRIEITKLSGDLTLSYETGHGGVPKMRLILRGPKGERFHHVPSSPRDPDNAVKIMRQWARRAGKELT